MNGPRVPDSFTHPLCERILEIRNKYTQEIIPYNQITFHKQNHMYSSKKIEPIWCLQMDGEHVSKHKPYIVKYKCSTCESIVNVGITQFLRKIQKENGCRCKYCVNKDEEKRTIHSNLLKDQPCTRYWHKEELPKDESLTNLERIHMYQGMFDETFDSDEKNAYFSYHLTTEEYARLKPHIVSFYHGQMTQEKLQELEYVPIWKCSNQMKYTCVFYNPHTDTIVKPSQIQCKCETCDCIFHIKNLHRLKNKYKVLCNDCSLCRNTFKKRPMLNIQGEKVIVQSQLETKFVAWCNNNDILVTNGPKLEYEWNQTKHTYHVDFEIPQLKWIIETKDMHIWHQEQILNGKWNEKKKIALQKVTDGVYSRFITVFPKNWIRIQKDILKSVKEKI